jgi:predicted outer membrane repeat protein
MRMQITLFKQSLLLVASLFGVGVAHADDATVGNGTGASCTEAALTTAINTVQASQGGTVRFNCGVTTRTIAITTPKNLTGFIVIDGEGFITLTGQDLSRIFIVNPRPNPEDPTQVTLQNITLRNGFASGGFGGAVLGNGGIVLNLNNVTINNSSAGLSGGALAMAPSTTLNISNSSFRENTAPDGGAITTSAVTTIENSRFVLNTANGIGSSGQGGAIQSYVADLSLRKNLFSFGLANRGGAVYKRGAELSIKDSQFDNNNAVSDGGAVFAETGVSQRTSGNEFRGNIATNGRGGAIAAGDLQAADSLFDNNRAPFGGAISMRPSILERLLISNSTLSNNFALQVGGGIEIASSEGSRFDAYQVTTSNNVASNSSGGDFYIGGIVFTLIQRSSLIDGQAAIAAGGGSVFSNSTFPVTFRQSLIFSKQGQDCSGSGSFISEGANVGAGSCNLTFPGDADLQADQIVIVRSQLGLGEFASYGGRFNHHMPLVGSPALNTFMCFGGDMDARLLLRNIGGRCDSGAVERQTGEEPAALFRNGFEGNNQMSL